MNRKVRGFSFGSSRWPLVVALTIGCVSVLLPLGWSGLWAPHELEVAELSRRIAVDLHGDAALRMEGLSNQVPTLRELGKGQLPFSSIALGFQLFGLSDWAGRLPLGLWAALGLVAAYLMVRRLYDPVAAAYGVIALATMPLYFLHARTLLGDGVALAANALATAGLALAVFQPGARTRAIWGWAALALVGLLAGFATRGALLGVACPALGVGSAWAISRLSGRASPTTASSVVGGAGLVLGSAALAAGIWALYWGSPDMALEVLGSHVNPPAKLPTHDTVLHQLGFGLFPWSAFAPFALALALRSGSDAASAGLRLCLANVFVWALALHGLGAAQLGNIAFVGTFAIAALIGVALRDAELQPLGTRLFALGAVALLVIFVADLRAEPEQSLRAYALADASFPQSFVASAKRWVAYGGLSLAALIGLSLGELPSAVTASPLHAESEYARWLAYLRNGWRGRLPAVLVGLTLLFGLIPMVRFAAARGASLPLLGALVRLNPVFGYAFLLPGLVVLIPLLFFALRDLSVLLLVSLRIPRPRVALASFAVFGLTLSLGYYPALASHLSPRDAFETFRRMAGRNEALGVLGQAAQVAPYYAGGQVHSKPSAKAALDWLLEAPAERRWLVFGAKDLAQLNHLHRQRTSPSANLPVLDASSSEVLLAASRLESGEVNDNPLARWISTERPSPQHPLDADLNGQLRCLGWSLLDREGKPVERAETGRPYEFQIHWEVTAQVSGTWKTFIHIDGGRRRYNGDHDTLQGKYPFRYWQKGDFITDVHTVELEPHFAGLTYQVYFGLFSGDKRLPVKSGRHHDNRLMGGPLVVR